MRVMSAVVLGPLALVLIAHGGLPFLLFVLLCAGVSLYEWFGLAAKTKDKVLYAVFGLLYATAAYACCYVIREAHSATIALLFILMVWSSDIGAYFAGKMIGGPKMAVAISPNKTWAGLGGAALFPALIAVIYVLWAGGGIAAAVLAGVVTGIAGQAGDLLISFVKRRAGVKDSGQIIPGHGGLLDRVDAMMLAAPVFLFFAGTVFHG